MKKLKLRKLIKEEIQSIIQETKNIVPKRITARRVKAWMKRLPENKWRKVYNVDARRVAFFAKNGQNATVPTGLQRAGDYKYLREKKMAKDYLKSIKERK